MKVIAYLEITMKINEENRPAAAKVYTDYRQPFLDTIKGALTKDLLVREEDVSDSYFRRTMQNILTEKNILILMAHCLVWFLLYLTITIWKKKSK